MHGCALQPTCASCAGVRYPSHLLPEVTALLQSAEQQAALAQSQLANGAGGHITLQTQKQQQEKASLNATEHTAVVHSSPESCGMSFI